jgi:hypothetical protein
MMLKMFLLHLDSVNLLTVLPSVIISYSSKDVKIAEAIENYLLENEFSIWRDKIQYKG